MKSVLIFSVLTFVLIFGGVAFLSSQLGKVGSGETVLATITESPELVRARQELGEEREALTRERDRFLHMRSADAVQMQVLEEGRSRLLEVAREIESRQGSLGEERERSVARLAKMYENMKPADAAPILSALEMATILEVLSRMREREAARVLAEMPPDLAARITTGMSLGGEG